MAAFRLFCLICPLISSQCVGIMSLTYHEKSVENAIFLALSMAPVFLFSGFLGKLSAIPSITKPMAATSYVRYPFEALLIILYGMNRCEPPSSTVSSSSSSLSSSYMPPATAFSCAAHHSTPPLAVLHPFPCDKRFLCQLPSNLSQLLGRALFLHTHTTLDTL